MTGKYPLLPPLSLRPYLGYYITVVWVFSRDFSVLRLNRHGASRPVEKPPSAINREWPSAGCARFRSLKTQMVSAESDLGSSMGLFVRDFQDRSNCFRRLTDTIRIGYICFTFQLYIMDFDRLCLYLLQLFYLFFYQFTWK